MINMRLMVSFALLEQTLSFWDTIQNGGKTCELHCIDNKHHMILGTKFEH
jgi:hypothetical protein